jgi:peroxiredoxin
MWPELTDDEGRVDLAVFTRLTDQVAAVDTEHGVAAVGPSARRRTEEMATLQAPDFAVDTIDGQRVRLGDFTGRKKLLVAFSSWCGCRYDLPSWQELSQELGPKGLSIIGIAVDEDPEAVRPWVDEAKVEFPVLLDRDHVITERYSMVNVPTVVWIDEDDQVVRPNDVAFSDDQFKEFHGIDSQPHLEALRRWVLDDELPIGDPDEVRDHQMPPTDDEQRARLEFRLAIHLRRLGLDDAAGAHFDAASALAPLDFTIRRAAMPLRGEDPFFGESFLALYEEWEAVGRPYYVKRDPEAEAETQLPTNP